MGVLPSFKRCKPKSVPTNEAHKNDLRTHDSNGKEVNDDIASENVIVDVLRNTPSIYPFFKNISDVGDGDEDYVSYR